MNREHQTLTIRHDYDSGTVVEGTTKNSPAHLALKAHSSWTWSKFARAWLLRSSRHRQAKPYAIDDIERVLSGLGYTVERDINDVMPSVDQREADLANRMEQRQDRLAERADAWAGKAAATRKKATDVFDAIPFGQPMMPGHHSYKSDRNRRERAWNNLGKSYEQANYAGELGRQAETASHHMGARYSPVTVGNRIKTLEADRNRLQRELDGHERRFKDGCGQVAYVEKHEPAEGEHRERSHAKAAELDQQLTYWRGVYAQLQAEGKASTVGPETVAKGDWVQVHGDWYRVRRVSKKSVSVPNSIISAPKPGEREYTQTVPWHKISDHRTTDQMDPAYVEAYETPGMDRIGLRVAARRHDAEN